MGRHHILLLLFTLELTQSQSSTRNQPCNNNPTAFSLHEHFTDVVSSASCSVDGTSITSCDDLVLWTSRKQASALTISFNRLSTVVFGRLLLRSGSVHPETLPLQLQFDVNPQKLSVVATPDDSLSDSCSRYLFNINPDTKHVSKMTIKKDSSISVTRLQLFEPKGKTVTKWPNGCQLMDTGLASNCQRKNLCNRYSLRAVSSFVYAKIFVTQCQNLNPSSFINVLAYQNSQLVYNQTARIQEGVRRVVLDGVTADQLFFYAKDTAMQRVSFIIDYVELFTAASDMSTTSADDSTFSSSSEAISTTQSLLDEETATDTTLPIFTEELTESPAGSSSDLSTTTPETATAELEIESTTLESKHSSTDGIEYNSSSEIPAHPFSYTVFGENFTTTRNSSLSTKILAKSQTSTLATAPSTSPDISETFASTNVSATIRQSTTKDVPTANTSGLPTAFTEASRWSNHSNTSTTATLR